MRIALYRGRSLVSRLIRFITWGPYSHAAIILSDGRIVEAWHNPPRVRVIQHLGEGHEHGTIVDIFDLALPHPESAELAALSMIGKKYDFAGILGFIIKATTHDRQKVFCSEAAMIAAKHGGVELLARVPVWKVSPTLLAMSPLLKFAGSVITNKKFTNLPASPATAMTEDMDRSVNTSRTGGAGNSPTGAA